MTDPIAAKLLDDLLVLANFHRDHRGYSTVEDALEYVKRAAGEHPQQLVTMSLARIFDNEQPGWREAKQVQDAKAR